MKQIYLKQRPRYTLVDDDLYEDYSRLEWDWVPPNGSGSGYAALVDPAPGGRKTYQYMHRMIMKAKPHEVVQHKDGNHLNNQKSNLVITSKEKSMAERAVGKHSTTGYKGVTWDEPSGKWQAKITRKGQLYDLGRYAVMTEAAYAYWIAAKALDSTTAGPSPLSEEETPSPQRSAEIEAHVAAIIAKKQQGQSHGQQAKRKRKP